MRYRYLFLVFTILFFSDAKSVQKESFLDLIQKAQNLSLQQERDQALSLLKRAYANEEIKKNQTEILKSMDQLSTLFYTEKGQSHYEFARATFRQAPAEAKIKLQQALAAEAQNILVLLEQSRLELYVGKCEDALAPIKKAQELHPYFSDLYLAKAQAYTCLQSYEDALVALKKADQNVYVFLMYTQIFLAQGETKQAEAYLGLAKIADPKFPEILFWEMQVRKKKNLSYDDLIGSYVKSCKAITSREYLFYQKEPRVCMEYKNLEGELKNQMDAENKKDN